MATPKQQDTPKDTQRREEPSMDPGKLDEAVKRGDTAKKAEEQRGYLTRVEIAGTGDAIDHQIIGGMTFGKDADGKVAFVDFGGMKSTPHYAGE